MSSILDFSFGKQSGTTKSLRGSPRKRTLTRGFAKHLKPGVEIPAQGTNPPQPGGGTNTETQYMIYVDPQFGQQVFVDGVDQSSTWPPGFVYPVLLTAGSIDPQNLVTLDISDPYPWAITVYADATKLVVGDMSSTGNYDYLWPPDVQGGGGK